MLSYKSFLNLSDETVCFMTVTKDMVYQWELDSNWQDKGSFRHNFKKMPIIYMWRPEAYCEKIKTMRIRLEIYRLTNTPRISFDSLKGIGNAVSGVAFDYVFMSTHLNVESSR